MKKKIYMIMFTFVAFLFIGAVNVNAETTYTVTTPEELEEYLFDSEGIKEATTIKLGASMSTNSINENDELGIYVKSNLTIDLNGKTLTTDSRMIFFSYYKGYTVSIIDTSAAGTGKIIVPGNAYNGFLLQMIDDNDWDGTSKFVLDKIYVENINAGNIIFRIDNSADQYNKFEINVKNSIFINAGETIEYSIPSNNFNLAIEPTTTFLANSTTNKIFVTDSSYDYSKYINGSDSKVRVKDTSTSVESELNLSTTEMYNPYYSIRIVPKNAEIYNITIDPTTNGTVTGILLTDVVSGEKRMLTITPNSGYMIDKVLVNTVDKTAEVEDNQILLNVNENKLVKVTFKKIVYDFLNGENLKTSDLTKLTFRINADYSKFENGGKVYVDNNLLTSTQYTSKSGSTIITLDEEYAETLTKGEHTLKVEFNNGGQSETTFTIENQTAPVVNPEDTTTPKEEETEKNPIEENPQTGEKTPKTENPQTGDNITISITLGILSVIGIAGASIYTKKRFN